MNPFETLEKQIEQIINEDSTDLVEKRNLLLEVEEFISSEDYQALSPDERGRLQTARKDLILLVQQSEEDLSRAEGSPDEAE